MGQTVRGLDCRQSALRRTRTPMLNPRGLALLALLFRAPESIAQSYSAPNCTRAECEVRAGELEASFEVRPNGYNNMPSGCLLFEHDVSAAWGCWQVIYVEGCVGDACRSDDAECPCTIMDCGDTARPTVAPTTPSLASRAPSVGRDARKGHWSAMKRRWWLPSSLIVLACGPCCAFVAGKRLVTKERVGVFDQGARESELVHVAALDAGGAKGAQLEL